MKITIKNRIICAKLIRELISARALRQIKHCILSSCLVLSCSKETSKGLTVYHLIRPSSNVEKCIIEGWNILDNQEKIEIEKRINTVFKEGFPFELKHDRVIYLYIFTLLSQLEIVALQFPMRALPEVKDKMLKKRMRQQLVDELFHAMLFSKIAYELNTYCNTPPEYNKSIDKVAHFIREEKDLGVAIVLLNLIAESWFEEFINVLSEHKIAPNVFNVILEDERRHVKEASLYKDISQLNKYYLRKQINYLEIDLLGDLFLQHKYSSAIMQAIGKLGCLDLINRIHDKHNQQIAQIDLPPNKKWLKYIQTFTAYLSEIEDSSFGDTLITQSTTREILLGSWKSPEDPTMFSMLSLNVTRLETFENKYPPQTLTGLMLQALSKLSKENPTLRNYVYYNKIYNMSGNYIHLVINLPGAANHLAMIKFKDPHEISLNEISERVQNYVEIMSYARYKTEELVEENPELLAKFFSTIVPDRNDAFKELLSPRAIFTLTNVGPWGGEQNLSPLLPFEALKLVMSQVERKQVWNNKTKEFEIQDRLPVGLSADHRVFDANMGTPKRLQIALDEMIDKLEQNTDSQHTDGIKPVDINQFMEFSNKILEDDLNLGFRFLKVRSHYWRSDSDIDALHKKMFSSEFSLKLDDVLLS